MNLRDHDSLKIMTFSSHLPLLPTWAGFPCHQQDSGEERCSAACLRKKIKLMDYGDLWWGVACGVAHSCAQ